MYLSTFNSSTHHFTATVPPRLLLSSPPSSGESWFKGRTAESGGLGEKEKEKKREWGERRRRRGRNGKRPPAQTPLKQKHPFSSENKPPSQDLREWATSAGRGSSNEGQDVPLRTHLRRAEGQKPEYIDPSLSLCHCPALPSHPSRVASVPPPPKKRPRPPLPARLPARLLLPLLPAVY